MLRSDADAPKPPAYPFINYRFKEPSSDKKHAIRQFLGVSLRALSSDFPGFPAACAAVPSRHRHVSASVRRYLRRPRCARKREKGVPSKIFQRAGKKRKILRLWMLSPLEASFPRNFLAAEAGLAGLGRTLCSDTLSGGGPRHQPQNQKGEAEARVDQHFDAPDLGQ
jgi:hypothetical protein